MMFLVVINAVTRFIWASIPGTLEIVESLMGVVSVMMLAYTQAQKGHVGVELVLSQMPDRTQNVINCITLLLALIFALFLAEENWKMGLDAWRAKDFATTYPHVPLYPSKLVVAVGISLLCLQIAADWIRSIKQLFGIEGPRKPN
jgi:TRAP-type mannitol/chloroaromatic compound transport system permease small subunit